MRIHDEIDRQLAAGFDDLEAHVKWRIRELAAALGGPVSLTDAENRRAFADVLDAYVPDGYSLLLVDSEFRPCQVLPIEGGVISFGGYLTTEGAAVAELERTLSLGRRLAVHHNFRVVPRYRGNRIAPRSLIKSVSLYDRLGIKAVQLRAAHSGCWYWARWGFHFADVDELVKVSRHAQAFVDAFGGGLDVSAFTHPQQFVALGEEAKVTCHDVIDAFPQRRETYEDLWHRNGLGMHDAVEFGKVVLMTGPAWDAVLDLEQGSADRLIFDDFASKLQF